MTEETAGTARPFADALPERVADRRRELGLGVADLARRSGLPAAWVAYVESGEATPSAPALIRLAEALETTVDDLKSPRGAEFTHREPPTPAEDGPEPRELVTMSEEECRARLVRQLVGRVAWLDAPEPFVLPVNYVLMDRDVMYATAAHSSLAAVSGPVLFEVDEVIEAARIGWSVLIRGTAEQMDELPELTADQGPWPQGRRDVCVRIRTERMTGRRVRPLIG